MFENIMQLSEAVEGYKMFHEMKAQKIIFRCYKTDNQTI